MIRLLAPLGICLVLLQVARPVAALAKDGRNEVRAAGVCGNGAASKLRLRSGDHGIELRFEVDHSRAGVVWRVVLVHERRIAWKGAARTTRPNGSFEVRRTLPDLPGADSISARAWGPRGLVCRAAATLPDSEDRAPGSG
ncbi:MAG: hypothetical protein ACXWZ8_08750 [Gaiellaceae bacterium]